MRKNNIRKKSRNKKEKYCKEFIKPWSQKETKIIAKRGRKIDAKIVQKKWVPDIALEGNLLQGFYKDVILEDT